MSEETTTPTDTQAKQAQEPTPAVDASAQAAPEASAPDPLEPLKKQIAALELEVAQHKEIALRTRAEMDNMRKRFQREKDDLRKSAAASLLEEIIPVLDNMGYGLQSAEKHPEAKVVTDGFLMVVGQFKNVLANAGLKEINPVGQPFNPHQHECIAHQPSDSVAEGQVMMVTRLGYTLGDKVLRPANVIVSSGKAPEQPNN